MACFRFANSSHDGHGAGFEEIYAARAPALLRYLKRVTGSRHVAEELLQETFLRLHVQMSSREPIANPSAWLFRVGTNLANDRARGAGREGRREEHYAASSGRVVEFARQLEQQQLIVNALRAVPPRMRQVLLLFVEGCSYREIAEITGAEAGHIGVLLQRARAAFGKQYDIEVSGNHGRSSGRRAVR